LPQEWQDINDGNWGYRIPKECPKHKPPKLKEANGAKEMPTYWELAKPTYIENWAPELYRMSIAQIDVSMTLAEANNIFEIVWNNKKPELDGLCKRLDEALVKMPNGAYVRLGSRSPKDSFCTDGFKVTKSGQVLTLFLNSERIFDDLCLAIKENYIPHIWVRQWIDIPKWSEFRCFMHNRKLVGISQYYYYEMFQEIIASHDSIKWAIEQFFPSFRDACHLDKVVFDIWTKRRDCGNETMWEVRLIEINPLFELTDPCLFNWHNPTDFNGDFRYIKKTDKPPEPPRSMIHEALLSLKKEHDEKNG
jgi:hypothetical protein